MTRTLPGCDFRRRRISGGTARKTRAYHRLISAHAFGVQNGQSNRIDITVQAVAVTVPAGGEVQVTAVGPVLRYVHSPWVLTRWW